MWADVTGVDYSGVTGRRENVDKSRDATSRQFDWVCVSDHSWQHYNLPLTSQLRRIMILCTHVDYISDFTQVYASMFLMQKFWLFFTPALTIQHREATGNLESSGSALNLVVRVEKRLEAGQTETAGLTNGVLLIRVAKCEYSQCKPSTQSHRLHTTYSRLNNHDNYQQTLHVSHLNSATCAHFHTPHKR